MRKLIKSLNILKEKESNYNKEREDEDKLLVELVKKGDKKAFESLMKKYERKVFGIAYGMLHNIEDAKEVTQEAFIKVFRYIPNFHGEASFYTWLYRITVNLSIDRLRKLQRQQSSYSYDDKLKIKQEKSEELSNIVRSSQNEDPERLTLEKEKFLLLKKAMEKLPYHHRSVIILREVEELSYKEIADLLGISIGTVMSRLHHARKKLIKMLKEGNEAS